MKVLHSIVSNTNISQMIGTDNGAKALMTLIQA